MLYREQPQFEFLELPNPYTSKLWQDQQSWDGSESAMTMPSGEADGTKAERHALQASDQAREHLPRPHDFKMLLSVESAILQAGIEVRI